MERKPGHIQWTFDEFVPYALPAKTWADIRRELDGFRNFVEPFKLPSTVEKVAFAAALNSDDQIDTSLLAVRLSYADVILPGDRTTNELIRKFNGDFEVRCNNSVRNGNNIDCDLDIVLDAVQAENFSPEFVVAWGRIVALTELHTTIWCLQEEAQRNFIRGLEAGRRSSRSAQTIWYCKWQTQHCDDLNQIAQRQKIDEQIRELCEQIFNGERQAPAKFDKRWFEKLICGEGDSPKGKAATLKPGNLVALVGRLIRLTPAKITELAASARHDSSFLPPLSIDKYPPLNIPA